MRCTKNRLVKTAAQAVLYVVALIRFVRTTDITTHGAFYSLYRVLHLFNRKAYFNPFISHWVWVIYSWSVNWEF